VLRARDRFWEELSLPTGGSGVKLLRNLLKSQAAIVGSKSISGAINLLDVNIVSSTVTTDVLPLEMN
jgi:hypothetical protein